MTSSLKLIEIVGEGKTDIGKESAPEAPETGVVPILVHVLCGNPADMRVKRKGTTFLQGKGWTQKVKFAKRQAFYNKSVGIVFVLDSEGDLAKIKNHLEKGRDAALLDFPMAIGVAHPCIEAWLLADAKAIRKGLELPKAPKVPDKPEELPAPRQNRTNNPKTVLASFADEKRTELSSSEKNRIALALKDMELLRTRCPLGFGPFATEVEKHIKPLFDETPNE